MNVLYLPCSQLVLCSLNPYENIRGEQEDEQPLILFEEVGRIHQCCPWFTHSRFHRGLGKEERVGMWWGTLSFTLWAQGVPEAARPVTVTLQGARQGPLPSHR